MNAARRSPALPVNKVVDGSLMEPYPHHKENPAKLQEHVDSMFVVGARLLESALDAPFVDAAAVLENTEYFKTELARDTIILPHCEDALKFYASLGSKDPAAFHAMIVSACHQDLKNSFNKFCANKTIRTGKKWVHYVNKHMADLHDSAAFNRKITAAAPVYPKKAVAGTAKASLLPPVRPPTTHTMPPKVADTKYTGMPELRNYKPTLDDSWEAEVTPGMNLKDDDDAPPPLGQPIANHKTRGEEAAWTRAHREKWSEKMRRAKAEGNYKREEKYRGKIERISSEASKMPELKTQDGAVEGDVGFFREIYYDQRKKHAQRNGKTDEANKYAKRRSELDKKNDAKNEAEAERRRANKEDDERRRREEAGDVLAKVSPAKVATQTTATDDLIDPSDPAEKMKSVKWLRECSNATGPQQISLEKGKTYMFFAPTDGMIDRLMETFASGDIGRMSKERVVSAHFALKTNMTTFKTLAGVFVEKDGTRITKPAVKYPDIVCADDGRVSSISVKGARVVVLPHENLFQVPKK